MIKSALMVAGDKEKHLNKLKTLKCNIAIVNLEDAVFDKTYALNLLKKKFSSTGMRYKNKKVVVRVNSLDSLGVSEIKIINSLKPNAIRIPKIKNKKDVKKALRLIHKDIEVHLSIETKEAFLNLNKLKISSRVTTVYLGILDLLESLKLPQSILQLDNPTIDYILSKFLIDSKSAGLNAVSFIFQDYKNIEEFKLWCEKEKKMGFSSKACISPAQVDIVNEIFNINSDEITRAKEIKKIFEDNKAMKITAINSKKYGFIDEPIYKNALLVLELNKT